VTRRALAACALGAAFVLGSPAIATASTVATSAAVSTDPVPPDVVLVVTDDQRWDTLEGMPSVQEHLVGPGVTFSEAFVVNPLCCPSRTSILTGLYSHSTGVYRQAPPFGRFEAFDDTSTLATWLDDAGYHTAMVGKYVDGGQGAMLRGYVPPGWDEWLAFVHADYEDYQLSRNGMIESLGGAAEDYSTDVLAHEAIRIVHEAEGPLFLMFAPAAPHEPATPAARHRDAPISLPPQRPPNYDEVDVGDKPPWLRTLPPLSMDDRARLDALRVDHARSLLAVDDAVGRLVTTLEETGRLENTIFIYLSDNGLAFGEHRWTKKEVPYEESIRVPLVVRADRIVTQPRVDTRLALNIDLAPTIAELAGIEPPGSFDGRSLVPALRGSDGPWRRDFLIEHLEGSNPVTTYCAVRTERELYVEYRDGFRELYDLRLDPYQLENAAGDRSVAARERSLAERLAVLCDPPPPDVAPIVRQAVAGGPVAAGVAAGALVSVAIGAVLGRRRRSPPRIAT